jgi:hypothetical protein
MSELFAVEGAKIYIGGVLSPKNADFVTSDFTSQTWVEIDGWETAGEIGDAAEQISTTLINRNRTIHQKGTRDGGVQEHTFAILPLDPGQIALRAAQKTRFNYAFRIVYNDAPAAVGSTPSEERYIALVMGDRRANGGANDVRKLSVSLAINSNIVEIAAVEGT